MGDAGDANDRASFRRRKSRTKPQPTPLPTTRPLPPIEERPHGKAATLILTNELPGLGSAGDIVRVKHGYARNYLIPQGFAVAWTRGGEKQVEQIHAARRARTIHERDDALVLKDAIEGARIRLAVKAGPHGRVFGSVRTEDVAAAVQAAGIGAIDKRVVHITSPIKSVGRHEATVRLHDDVTAVITLQVVAAR